MSNADDTCRLQCNHDKGISYDTKIMEKAHKAKDKINTRLSKEWVYGFNIMKMQRKQDGLDFEYYACIEAEDGC